MSWFNPLSWFSRGEVTSLGDMNEPLIKPGFWARLLPQRLETMPDADKPTLWQRLTWRLQESRVAAGSDFAGDVALSDQEQRRLRWRRALIAIPSVLVSASLGGILYYGYYNQHLISMRYRDAARLAVDDGDITLARFYYSRLMGEGALGSSQDELNWAMMLTNTGDLPGAIKILDKLAPETTAGYAPAHRYKALFLLNMLRSGTQQTSEVTPRLQWHLKNGAREPIAANHQLWAAFYAITGQMDKAVTEQTLAAQQNPDLWIEAAALCNTPDRQEDRARFLTRAENHARHSLEVNALDVRRRLMLTRVLVDQKRLDEAEAILVAGYELAAAPELRRGLSDLEVVRYEQTQKAQDRLSDNELEDRVARLGKALQIDPTNPAVLKHWGVLHDRLASPEQQQKLRATLEQSIVEGKATAFGHFTLGGMLWQADQRERALFHMEQSFKLDPRFMDAANNLAWMLATQDKPDLERADALIREALKLSPSNISYLDTLTEVLVKQSQWRDALVVLEKLYPRSVPRQRKDLHRRLAMVYENLGQPELAKLHREQAERK